MPVSLTILALLLLALAVRQDVVARRIPNEVPVGLALLFAATAAIAPGTISLTWTPLVAGVVLLTGFGLFALGLIGAGDAKLLAALTLVVGWQDAAAMLLVTALAGGLMSIALLHPALATIPAVALQRERGLPFAAAIAAGGAAVLIPPLLS
mgnify:CR=1 FL=1